MTMLSIAPDLSNLDVKVLATDIDADVLEIAKTGFYHPSEIENISAGYQKKYFSPSTNGTQKGYLIDQRIRGLISFRELNLLHDWPMNGLFDAIFCRNVVIYFDESTQLRLWPRFEKATAPGGWLFVGHSERLSEKLGTSFQNVGPTTYRLPN